MREWNLKAGDPLVLVISADARLGPTSYTDDHTWELSLGEGEPAALALHTLYGLPRCGYAPFLAFKDGDTLVQAPAESTAPPVVQRFYPNYLRVSCAPLPDTTSGPRSWVPGSQIVAGRLRLTNHATVKRSLRLELAALLLPGDEGERMAPHEMQAVTVLVGSSAGLAPLTFMTGGPQVSSGPYPALQHELSLAPARAAPSPGATPRWARPKNRSTWARLTATRPWEAEIARLEMLNSSQIEIHTGLPEWDAALALAQTQALRLLVGPGENLPHPSLVQSRQPDQGYSLRGDGTDYNHLWNGQSPLETCYLAGLMLPGSASLVQGLLRNFLAVQASDGSIDWKPGLAGQRSRLLATPILAHLAWRIYQSTLDKAFIAEVFPGLLRFLQAWFTPETRPGWRWRARVGAPHPDRLRRPPDILALARLGAGRGYQRGGKPGAVRLALPRDRVPGVDGAPAGAQRAAAGAALLCRPPAHCAWNFLGSRQHQLPLLGSRQHHTSQSALLAERSGEGELEIQRDFDPPARLLLEIETQRARRCAARWFSSTAQAPAAPTAWSRSAMSASAGTWDAAA